MLTPFCSRCFRFDFVEVDLESRLNPGVVQLAVAFAAQLMYFICYKDKLQFVVLRYYTHFSELEPNLGVYVCNADDEDDTESYGVLPISAILCHAHLIPDFDALEASADRKRWLVPPGCDYFWDKVQDGRINEAGAANRGSLLSRRSARRKARREALRRAAVDAVDF